MKQSKIERLNISVNDIGDWLTDLSPNQRGGKMMILAKVILLVVSVAGALSIAFIAPNIVQLLKHQHRGRRIYPTDVRRSIRLLERRGWIRSKQKADKNILINLTAAGRRQLTYWQALRRVKPQRWDGQWRLVCFDVPHMERSRRALLRRKLQEIGFLQVQKSVYLFPYECEKMIRAVQNYYHLHNYLFVATIDKLAHDQRFRKHFSLPSANR